MEGAAREVADLASRAAAAGPGADALIGGGGSGGSGGSGGLRPGGEELLRRLQRYVDEITAASEERSAEVRRDADELAARHTDLRRRLRLLYNGYRALRCAGALTTPALASDRGKPSPALADAVLAGGMEEILKQDEGADRAAMGRALDKAARLEAELGALKVRQLEFDTLGPQGLGRLAAGGQPAAAQRAAELRAIGAGALQLENVRLREELDRLKRRLTRNESVAAAAAGTAAGQPDVAVLQEMTKLRLENAQLRADAVAAAAAPAAAPASAARAAAGAAPDAALRRQVKEFAATTQSELERKLQAYLSQASVAYQREIVRLRAALGAAAGPEAGDRQPGGGGPVQLPPLAR
ncbi:hypothetical protein MNEG_10860 [Monoraphidium neglectum]|uniref:Uncharacterized protein n=1 Tax=Monoraphidium neglectum TaxID=145388 RepID=A0A0D2MR90_9CHLO|nr:hypothetical protein MNEG_10860 [Monoraphidium neglectum]KIY97100.1 hypothetical protein MNEG_10860 [Monoraphidium neglectum]|eukprot:XP_013896120.1 hypothetical protein MNEG_10860 [Monoraphidium neglectum]